MIYPRSLRTKLTLWYAGILAVSLLGFGALFYLGAAFNLRRELDQSLRLQAEGAAGAIRAFREADDAATGGGPGNWQRGPISGPGEMARRGLFPELVTRWAEKTGGLSGGRPIRLLDSSGQAIIASGEFERLKITEEKQKPPSQDSFRSLELPGGPLRLITHPLMEQKRLQGFVQVGASLRPMRTSLRLLLLWLACFLPLILGVASLGGWFLASRALGPVDRIITQVEEISAEALERRVDIPRTGDELERLARTFDQMLERIERAFRRLRQFSAAASHELRTPLTVMKGELELALRRPRTPDEYETILRTQLSALNDLVQVVEELLMLARSEAVRSAVEWRPVDLSEMAKGLEELWGRAARQKGVKLEMEAQKPVWVKGEKRLLERLAANLVENAIRVTPSNGTVTVRVTQWKGYAQWMVQDTGPGISAEEMPQIFDRFFQPRREEDGKSGSSGLGLGLCRWIAEAHRGRIEVSSTLGRGSLFTVWLPLPPPGPASGVGR